MSLELPRGRGPAAPPPPLLQPVSPSPAPSLSPTPRPAPQSAPSLTPHTCASSTPWGPAWGTRSRVLFLPGHGHLARHRRGPREESARWGLGQGGAGQRVSKGTELGCESREASGDGGGVGGGEAPTAARWGHSHTLRTADCLCVSPQPSHFGGPCLRAPSVGTLPPALPPRTLTAGPGGPASPLSGSRPRSVRGPGPAVIVRLADVHRRPRPAPAPTRPPFL